MNSGHPTLGVGGRWVAWKQAAVKSMGYRVELLVGFGQRQQFEQRVEREFQQWQRQQQQ
ncbi:hypothetical protein CCP3SC15_270007 [Gammaproteobacteria bacterium]